MTPPGSSQLPTLGIGNRAGSPRISSALLVPSAKQDFANGPPPVALERAGVFAFDPPDRAGPDREKPGRRQRGSSSWKIFPRMLNYLRSSPGEYNRPRSERLGRC